VRSFLNSIVNSLLTAGPSKGPGLSEVMPAPGGLQAAAASYPTRAPREPHLHGQVAARHHDAIAGGQDLVVVGHAVPALDLGDDPDACGDWGWRRVAEVWGLQRLQKPSLTAMGWVWLTRSDRPTPSQEARWGPGPLRTAPAARRLAACGRSGRLTLAASLVQRLANEVHVAGALDKAHGNQVHAVPVVLSPQAVWVWR
jgi:hypothetical protein